MTSNNGIDGLGYEQLLALRIMRDAPNQEASAITKTADCLFEELFRLSERGLIDLGMERLEPNRVHPVITEKGRAAVSAAEGGGVIPARYLSIAVADKNVTQAMIDEDDLGR